MLSEPGSQTRAGTVWGHQVPPGTEADAVAATESQTDTGPQSVTVRETRAGELLWPEPESRAGPQARDRTEIVPQSGAVASVLLQGPSCPSHTGMGQSEKSGRVGGMTGGSQLSWAGRNGGQRKSGSSGHAGTSTHLGAAEARLPLDGTEVVGSHTGSDDGPVWF